MALMENQCDIINDKINIIYRFYEKNGRYLSFDEQGIIKWFFQYRVNHKGETFLGTISKLDNLITKSNKKTINFIIEEMLSTAKMEYANLNSKEKPMKKNVNSEQNKLNDQNIINLVNGKVLVKRTSHKERM